MGRSEILRSALRGFSDVGFRRENVLAIIGENASGDTGAIGGNPDGDLPDVGAELHARLDIIHDELNNAIALGGPTFPYVEFVLAELGKLRDGAFDLARDDTYETAGTLSTDAPDGVIANDIAQPGRTIEVDVAFQGAIPPSDGMLTLNADGSFTYTPDAGFTGVDSFTYRLRALVDESMNPVGDPYAYSSPTTVIVRVDAPDCPADLAEPFGVLNFNDVIAFLTAFSSGDPSADLAEPFGVLNFNDIVAYLTLFGQGCP